MTGEWFSELLSGEGTKCIASRVLAPRALDVEAACVVCDALAEHHDDVFGVLGVALVQQLDVARREARSLPHCGHEVHALGDERLARQHEELRAGLGRDLARDLLQALRVHLVGAVVAEVARKDDGVAESRLGARRGRGLRDRGRGRLGRERDVDLGDEGRHLVLGREVLVEGPI